MKTITFGSLFAGVGGFDLGFERAGMRCLWQVEIDDYASKVLAKHWPSVKRHDDVRTFARFAHEMKECDCCELHEQHFADCGCLGISEFADEWGQPDVLCGGFPCQDVSNAGLREGITGDRSGLWFQFRRIIEAVAPKVAVIENVGGLSARGLNEVIEGLTAIGYDAEWCPLPAAAFGAVHRRARIFIVANPAGERLEGWFTLAEELQEPVPALGDARDWPAISESFGCRALHGIPNGMDRLRCLGNAVVPQVAEWIGRRIVDVLQYTATDA